MSRLSLGTGLLVVGVIAGCAVQQSKQLSTTRDGALDFAQEYSITSRVEVLKPITLEALNNDFQLGKVVAESTHTVTLEVRTFPLRSQKPLLTANPNWRQEYRSNPELQRYLRPGITTNWDGAMRQELIEALAADGIQIDQLNDKQLVETVSRWLFGHPPFGKFPFKDFFVSYYLRFTGGTVTVIPELRSRFDSAKRAFGITTDEEAFAIGAYGKSMFRSRTRGNCTASATLAATVFKALGIPTRIVLYIPPIDSTDPVQVNRLQTAIHHSALLPTIMEGIATQTESWSSHTFNEVYVGNQWVRLNYTELGQDPVDADYLGLMIQVLRVSDWAESGLPETWGVHAEARNIVTFSSANPYRGLAVADYIGSSVQLPNPPQPFNEIRRAKILSAYSNASPGLSEVMRQRIGSGFLLKASSDTPNKDNWKYFRLFTVRNRQFVLRAPGRPDVSASSSGSITDPGYEGWRLFANDQHERMVPGVAYHPIPVDQTGEYRWEIPDSLTIMIP